MCVLFELRNENSEYSSSSDTNDNNILEKYFVTADLAMTERTQYEWRLFFLETHLECIETLAVHFSIS